MGEVLTGTTLGLKVGGGILRARGARQTGDAIADAARYNAELARREGTIEEARIRRFARRELSARRVRVAASGLQLEGSPSEQIAFAASEFERDAVNARISAESTAALEESRARNAEQIGGQRSLAEIFAGGADAGSFGLSLLLDAQGPPHRRRRLN